MAELVLALESRDRVVTPGTLDDGAHGRIEIIGIGADELFHRSKTLGHPGAVIEQFRGLAERRVVEGDDHSAERLCPLDRLIVERLHRLVSEEFALGSFEHTDAQA